MSESEDQHEHVVDQNHLAKNTCAQPSSDGGCVLSPDSSIDGSRMLEHSNQDHQTDIRCSQTGSDGGIIYISDSSSDNEEATDSLQAPKRNVFQKDELSISKWSHCETEIVDKLPLDIIGHRKFKIVCPRSDVMKQASDGRNWKTWTSGKRKFFRGIRRIARCNGTFTCLSTTCPYFLQFSENNKMHFKQEGSRRLCFTCGLPAERVLCNAVSY